MPALAACAGVGTGYFRSSGITKADAGSLSRCSEVSLNFLACRYCTACEYCKRRYNFCLRRHGLQLGKRQGRMSREGAHAHRALMAFAGLWIHRMVAMTSVLKRYGLVPLVVLDDARRMGPRVARDAYRSHILEHHHGA